MVQPWEWIVVSALACLVIGQSLAMYAVRRKSKKQEELFRIVTENAADMIALVDVKGHRLYNSPAYKRILGYTAAELGETSVFEQIHPDDKFKVLEAGREARETGVGKRLQYRIRHKDGSWRVLESIAQAIRNEQGEVTKLVIVNRDVTERKRAEEQLEHNSFHDALTGLPNRRLFLDRLQHLFERTRRNPERHCAVMVVDLDGFKELNEKHGTALCDRILIETGQRIDSCLRDEDTISRPQDELARNAVLSRMGGDEFTILLEGVGDPSNAMRAGSRVVCAIAEPMVLEGQEIRITASAGIALSTAAHERPDDVLQEADVAMRRAKAVGGGRCELFSEAMHARAVNQLRLEAELESALTKHQFLVYYQPIVALKSGRITGFEALLRWKHPEQGLISPYRFLATAENAGLLASTGHWVIAEACKQLHAWTMAAPNLPPMTMAVNISAKQLADARFVKQLENALHDTGVDPSQLHLEMTEIVAGADPTLTTTILANLKRLRVGVLLDDFGTGNSSLLALRKFPVEAVKIDRSLVTEMLLDRAAADIVELIVMVAHKLKLRVIAEGIESGKQLEHLNLLGCESGQGYYFSAPVDAKAAQQLLLQRTLAPQAEAARGSN